MGHDKDDEVEDDSTTIELVSSFQAWFLMILAFDCANSLVMYMVMAMVLQ